MWRNLICTSPHHFTGLARSTLPLNLRCSHTQVKAKSKTRIMGKNNRNRILESSLILPPHSSNSSAGIVDTHTHLVSTFSAYQSKFKDGKHATIHEFVRGMYGVNERAGSTSKVEAIIDVWCEAPVRRVWREVADSALTEEQRRKDWGEVEYWFVMGASILSSSLRSLTLRQSSLDITTGVHPYVSLTFER